MTDEIRKLHASIEAKQAEADKLLATDGDSVPPADVMQKADNLLQEIARDREQLEAEIKGAEDRQAKASEFRARLVETKQFLRAPATSAPHARNGEGPAFKLAGLEYAGVSTYDAEHKQMIAEAGAGTVGEKAWQAMSSAEYTHAFKQYLRKGQRFLDGVGYKILQEGLDDQGGVFAPAEFIMRVIGRLPAPTSLRGRVTTITTGRDRIVMPRKQYGSDDKYTTAFRATFTGEIPSSDTVHNVNDANLLGTVEVGVVTAMLSAPLTRDQIEDAAFPMQSWLEGELNQTIDLLYEDMILNGTGIGQPFGILSNIGSANRPEVVLSGTANVLTYDGLIDLQTAIAPQYEGNACWVANKKSTLRALYKLKDSQNRPLLHQGFQDYGIAPARERTLLGDPIVLSQFMPDVGTPSGTNPGGTGYPIVYGDLKGYYLAQRVGFSIQVLNEIRARANQIELLGRVRFGGAPIEHWRMKIQKSNNT